MMRTRGDAVTSHPAVARQKLDVILEPARQVDDVLGRRGDQGGADRLRRGPHEDHLRTLECLLRRAHEQAAQVGESCLDVTAVGADEAFGLMIGS